MKKLNITKEQFNRSRYFKNKYGTLKYVSESGKFFKTSKGKVLKFNERGFVKKLSNGCKLLDMGDTFVVTDKYGKNIGQCKTEIEADEIADSKAQYAESKKLVKEGAGAGYTIEIEDLKIGKVKVTEDNGDGSYEWTAPIIPDDYEVNAYGYYDQFFPLNEWDEPTIHIDGGMAYGTTDLSYVDEEELEELGAEQIISNDVSNTTISISTMYGGGWTHVNLPENGKIHLDNVSFNTDNLVDELTLDIDSKDMAQSINYGHEHCNDVDEEIPDDEMMQESRRMSAKKDDDGWFGIKNAKFVYHGDWADPEVIYDGVSINYYDVESWLLDVYREENPEDRKDSGFGKWMALPSTKPEIQSCLDCIVQAMAENGEIDDNEGEDEDEYTESIDDSIKLEDAQDSEELIESILDQLHFGGAANFDLDAKKNVFHISNGNGKWRIEVSPEKQKFEPLDIEPDDSVID